MRPNRPYAPILPVLSAAFVVLAGAAFDVAALIAQPKRVADEAEPIAGEILDEDKPREQREALIRDHPKLAVELVAAMTADLEPGTKEEYRRIPWIWRVAVAAGRRDDAGELRRFLDSCLPQADEPLRDWQAVVIGGGITGGISLADGWPAERIAAVVGDDALLHRRWHRAIDLAAAMADDESVPTGTRYDALRMLAMQSWERRGAQLFRYLLKGTHPELQQGALSALADLRSPATAQALLSGIEHYSDYNRNLALDALLRSDDRVSALLDALAHGRVRREHLGDDRIGKLRNHANAELQERAHRLLPE